MSNGTKEAQLAPLYAQAEHAARSGQTPQAIALYRQVLVQAPDHPRALNALGNFALAAGQGAEAVDYLSRAVAGDPGAPPLWLNLALAQRAVGDAAAEFEALDGALRADPYFVVALLHKAQWFERYGRMEEATIAYRGLLSAAPPLETLPTQLRVDLERGKKLVDAANHALEAKVRAAVGERGRAAHRFDHAVEILGGRRRIYLPKPVGLHFPYLPADQYFAPELFPWLAELEAATGTIRAEMIALGRGPDLNRPYVHIAPGQPANQWVDLNNSLDWSAIFLRKNGVAVRHVYDRCPATAALIERLPLFDVPGRGPTAMFSTLKPHTRIPAHHGVTNIRAVVHLPLIVPPDCRFRVGSETRAWEEGKAWAFDDTIEHEAWNDSAETRVILILDAWNPHLTEEERALLRVADQVLGRVNADVE